MGSSGAIRTSPDGETWTAHASGTTSTFYSIAWEGSQFVAMGSSGTIRTSPNGETWTARSLGTPRNLYGVTWGNGKFVAVGAYGTILSAGPLPVLTVQSSDPASGVVITSSTGHGGDSAYIQLTASCTTVNLEAPEYHGSGAERKRFDGWSGAVTSDSRSITFVMDGDKTVTANYVDDPIAPTADFSGDPTSGVAPLQVQFTDAVNRQSHRLGLVFWG